MIRTFLFALALGLGLAGMANAAPMSAARADAVSRQLVEAGDARLAADDVWGAVALFESASVANPKNTAAFVGLGRAYDSIADTVNALKYYDLALAVDPNDLPALEGQALTYLKQGDFNRAEINLSRIKRICASGCDALNRVNDAIAAALEETQRRILGEKTASAEDKG